jgi:hypothetical protein
VHLAGTLETTGLGFDAGDGHWRARVRLLSLDKARYDVLGQNIAAESAGWTGRDAWVRYDENGTLLHVRQPADTPQDEAFVFVLRALLQSAMVTTQTVGEEDTVLGSSRVRYSGEGEERVRAREAYTRLEGLDVSEHDVQQRGRATLRVHGTGYVVSLKSSDEVKAVRGQQVALTARSSLEHKVLSVRQLDDAVRTPALAAAPDLRKPASPEVKQKLLESRAAGMTPGQLASDLDHLASTGAAPENAWLPQAAAVLRLHPEASASVARVVKRKDAPTKARAVGVDLLSQVGHAEAQAALVDALGAETVRSDASYALLLQRLGFVSEPTAATVAFAEQLRASDDVDLRRSATHAYGALAGGLDEAARTEEAARIVASLADELRGAGDVADQAALIGALGNAGTAVSYDVVATYAQDDHAKLRGAAATALRGAEDRAERELLVALVADPALAVQRAAIRSLTQRALEDWEQSRVATSVEQGRTARANDGVVVTLLQTRVAPGARAAALRFLLARADDAPRMRARIRAILGEP